VLLFFKPPIIIFIFIAVYGFWYLSGAIKAKESTKKLDEMLERGRLERAKGYRDSGIPNPENP